MWYILALTLLATACAVPTPKTFKICVPHNAYDACQQMVDQGKSVGVTMACVAARDRLDCMTKMKEHEADWEAVDPEDMYIAAKRYGDNFSIFKEIRTKEEPEAEFRYEAVVVIHKELEINSIEELRGLKSCHTGVGRHVGYKIPITKLTKMGILPPQNDTKVSPRENELKALSTFFSKSCIVGKWSPDQEINQRLKQQYSNLCQLCEFPDKCDYPDQNSGYEGALRCLAVGGGDVAFTKVIFVKKFFGMAYGSQPATHSNYIPDDYSYLCPDATKKPVKGEPCVWAARPWQGYMTTEHDQEQVTALRDAIAKLNALGESSHADWISSVLALNNLTLTKDNKGPYTPHQYLVKAKFEDVIERDVLEPRRLVRMCVTGEVEEAKCQDLASAAYSRDIRPGISCVSKLNLAECYAAARDHQVDIVSVDACLAFNAVSHYQLQPVLMEEYENDHKTHAVAVVKKSSNFQSWADLKGHKACFSHVGKAAGWVIPVYNLVTKSLIEKNNCPYTKAVGEFFSGGVQNSAEPFKCLSSGEGDVAFLDYDSAVRQVGGEDKSGEYELLCKDGGRKAFKDYASCNQGAVPPRVLLSSKDLSPVEKDDILFTMLSAADLYHKHPEYFDLFGSYQGHDNVLFSNSASGLETVHPETNPLKDFTPIHDELKACTPEEKTHWLKFFGELLVMNRLLLESKMKCVNVIF
ncbi:mitochondrial translation elongation factor EF-Ts tsf1 [Homalodisca vitripennis]|nr:mitochondrial translation elongation factor EF-Ts tsf1 [Homalodisca vitripennis]